MQPYDLRELLKCFRNFTKDVILYLPRTSDVRQLANQAESSERITVMHYCMEGASKVLSTVLHTTGESADRFWGKAICSYYGAFNLIGP